MTKMNGLSNGGIGGTGIFGFFGTTIHCSSTDTSFFCTIMKYFQLMIVFIFVIFIIYLIYSFVTPYFSSKSRKNRA